MKAPNPVDVRQLIDQLPIGRYQKWVVFLGFLIIALDGLDVAIIGFIAPQLKSEWHLGAQSPVSYTHLTLPTICSV